MKNLKVFFIPYLIEIILILFFCGLDSFLNWSSPLIWFDSFNFTWYNFRALILLNFLFSCWIRLNLFGSESDGGPDGYYS
jgi:hypothetical protein